MHHIREGIKGREKDKAKSTTKENEGNRKIQRRMKERK